MRNLSPVTVILYFIAFSIIFSAFYFLGIAELLPNNRNVVNWDAAWYSSIANQGYNYDPSSQSNAGFFPLFPKIWEALHLSPIGISIFNLICFVTGFFWIVRSFKIDPTKSIWLLSLPSLLFFIVPYSEALFFLFSAGFLVNYKEKNDSLALLFILLMGMVRPIFIFFIPAFGAVLLIQKFWKKENLRHIAFPFVALLSSIIAFWVISLETGDFFSYSKSQTQHWNHIFGMPSLPFTTWRGYRILWLDATALFAIIVSFGFLMNKYFSNKSVIKLNNLGRVQLLQIFSAVYLLMILIYVTFFHMEDNGQTSLLSINRYVFTCPFFFYLLGTFSLDKQNSVKAITPAILALIATMLLIGWPYSSIEGIRYSTSVIFGLVLIAYISLQFIASQNKFSIITYGIIGLNLLIQVYLYQSFLKGNWIG